MTNEAIIIGCGVAYLLGLIQGWAIFSRPHRKGAPTAEAPQALEALEPTND